MSIRIRIQHVLLAFILCLALSLPGLQVFAADTAPSSTEMAATESANVFVLNKSLVAVKAGAKAVTLTAKLNGKKVSAAKIEWESSDPEVVTVSKGKLTFHEAGSATITADYNGDTDVCEVNVLKLAETSATLNAGDELTNTLIGADPELVTWKTSNTKVATVDSEGVITPVGYGKATITATYAKQKFKCSITSSVSTIVMNKKEVTISGKTKKASLSAKVTGKSKTVTWDSSDESIATVSKGKVTFTQPGSVTITATANNVSDTAQVSYLNINKTTATLNEGETDQLYIQGTEEPVEWKSSAPKYVTVDENGTITPVGYGTSTITGTIGKLKFTSKVTSTVPTISLNKESIVVTGSTKTGSLSAKVTGKSKTVTWTSSNPDVVSVTKGKLTYKNGGTAVITATANGKSATCNVAVIQLNKTTLDLDDGDTAQLSIVGNVSDDITWKSSNSKIATVDGNGLVTAVGYGSANVTAVTTVDGKKTTLTCKVTSKVKSITLNKSEIISDGKAATTVTATLSGITGNVQWSSSDESVVSVVGSGTNNKTGKLTFGNGGTATITAYAENKSASCTVYVMKLNASEVEIAAGQTYQLTLTGATDTVTWKSSNVKVAEVSDSGLVTPVANGSATITAKCGSKSFTCKVVVDMPSIKLNLTEYICSDVSETIQLKATVVGKSKEVTWDTTNQDVATVSPSGLVTFNKAGSAVITATANGVSAQCTVVVSALNYEHMVLNEGDTKQLILKDAPLSQVTFVSADPSIAKVDASGWVTPVGYGETEISVIFGGNTLTCTVQSTIPSLKLNLTETAGYKGDTVKLTATYAGPTKAGTITWASSDKTVATVSTSGTVTLKGEGECEITATAKGKTATCKFTVWQPTIDITEDHVYMTKDGAYQLSYDIDGPSLVATWKSSNTKVVTVDANGMLAAKKAGTVTITAKANGVSDTVIVVVTDGETIAPGTTTPVAGQELVATADSQEEAQQIAEMYGITLVKYEYGAATYTTTDDPQAVIAYGKAKGYPSLSINNSGSIPTDPNYNYTGGIGDTTTTIINNGGSIPEANNSTNYNYTGNGFFSNSEDAENIEELDESDEIIEETSENEDLEAADGELNNTDAVEEIEE